MSYGTWPMSGPNGTYTQKGYLNGQLTSTTVLNMGASCWGSKTRTGGVTPGFHLKRATGLLPENDFTYGETFTTAAVGYTYSKRVVLNNVYEQRAGGIYGGTTFSNPWTNLAVLKANFANVVDAKLMGKIKETEVDVAVFLGELRETKQMFAGSVKNLFNALNALTHGASLATVGAHLGVRLSPKTPANGWLLVQYGIMPFIRDIEGATKALEKGLLKLGYKLARARHVYTDTITQTANGWTKRWSLKLETSGRVKYRVVNEYIATLASLGLTNPLVLGWELTKLSFVVDWLVGIGAWLNQLDAFLGKEFDQGSRTWFVRIECEATWDKLSQPDYLVYLEQRKQSYSYVSVERHDMAGWPIALTPGIRDPSSLNVFHLLTSLALLVQQKR